MFNCGFTANFSAGKHTGIIIFKNRKTKKKTTIFYIFHQIKVGLYVFHSLVYKSFMLF